MWFEYRLFSSFLEGMRAFGLTALTVPQGKYVIDSIEWEPFLRPHTAWDNYCHTLFAR
jgi:hypothetical protein